MTNDLQASWTHNAARWTEAVRGGAIESRRLVTDKAVVDAVTAHGPSSLLDVGCGEGWLCRALAGRVETIVGIDGSAELIANAEARGGARFLVASYADIVTGGADVGGGFDVIVANFALLDADLAPLLAALGRRAAPEGVLIIQTVHPFNVPPPYVGGWRSEDFAAFGERGWQPMPWYFRTIADWFALLPPHWRLLRLEEPLHPETLRPASLIIVAARVDSRENDP